MTKLLSLKSSTLHSLFSLASTSALLAVAAALGGCILDGEDPIVEGSEQDAKRPPSASATVQIRADSELKLVLYREGTSGAWRKATRVNATRYQATVRGPYTVIAVCTPPDGPVTAITSATLEDELLVELDCVPGTAPVPAQVNGTMAQAGIVSLGEDSRLSLQPNWSFSLFADPGTYDLIAGGGDRALVRRGLAVSGPMSVPPIDLDAQGTALSPVDVSVTNLLPGETLTGGRTWLYTARNRGRIYRGLPPMKVAPASMLQPGDSQSISLDVNVDLPSGFSTHGGVRPYGGGASATYTLWRPFAAIPQLRLDGSGDQEVAWQATTAFKDTEGVTHYVFDDLGHFHYHTMTASYLRQTKASKLTVFTHVAGYLPEWRVSATDYTRDFGTARQNSTEQDRDGYSVVETLSPLGLAADKRGDRQVSADPRVLRRLEAMQRAR